MTLYTWLSFVAASSLILLIPGPTILLVTSYAFAYGKRFALASSLGVVLGDLVAMSLSLAGLGALILASAQLFSLLKWLGAAYLIYMGISILRSSGTAQAQVSPRQPTARQVCVQAFWVTVLNPKSHAFFWAFVPQFLVPTASLVPQISLLVLTFVCLAGINALGYALLAAKIQQGLNRPTNTGSPRILVWLKRLSGAVLILMGLYTTTQKIPA